MSLTDPVPNVPPLSDPTSVTEVTRVRLGDLPDSRLLARSRKAGYTELTIATSEVLNQIGRDHGKGDFFKWGVLDEGKNNGSYYLSPTIDTDKDKIKVTWMNGGTVAGFSLRKLLALKGIKIPKDHTLGIPCAEASVTGVGKCLELKFAARTIDPITTDEENGAGPGANGRGTAKG